MICIRRITSTRSIVRGLLLAAAIAQTSGHAAAPAVEKVTPVRGGTPAPIAPARKLDWEALLPSVERGNFSSAPPEPVHDYLGERGARVQQSGSTEVDTALDGVRVKLPGFIVPLGSSEDGAVTEFFLVPYFGACIHVPPPPPNQIVYAHLTTPIKTPEIWDPYWLRGELRVETKKNKLAGSAYTMTDASLVPYDG
jgi:hypothetical protein